MVSMANTVVGVFDDYTEAEATRSELLESGFREEQVRLSERSTPDAGSTPRREGVGFWDSVREFFGAYDEDSAYYEEASRRGGAVITVSSDRDNLDTAVNIIQQHHPVDIDKRAQEWRKSGWQGPQAGSAYGGESTKKQERIPIAEEKLKVGKRKEQRGGVRIYSHTHEQPVEKDIHLTEERVNVKRQAADRPADDAAFKERSFEVTESREEPVVQKESRVTEEVVIDKDVEHRDETIRDTVRKQEVEVEDANRSRRGQGASGSNPGKPTHGPNPTRPRKPDKPSR